MERKNHKGREKFKILIVDPNEEDLKKIYNIFINEGVSVFSTDTMEKAIKIHKIESPSVIISEYILGEYNTGVDLVRKVRKNDEQNQKTPFILHTSTKNKNILIQAEMEGVDKCFIKPLSESGIKRLIRSVQHLIKQNISK